MQWMETRREGLCTEEAQGPPALQRRGTSTWDHWLVTGKGERKTGETISLEVKGRILPPKKPLLVGVGCGQDISRNVISGIDF